MNSLVEQTLSVKRNNIVPGVIIIDSEGNNNV
jgi:hypothetical protein